MSKQINLIDCSRMLYESEEHLYLYYFLGVTVQLDLIDGSDETNRYD